MKYLFIYSLLLMIGFNTCAQKILAQQKFAAENIQKLSVDGSFCDINIIQGESFTFEGIIEGKGEEGDFEFVTDLNRDEIIIKVLKNSRNGWSQLRKSVMNFTIPSGTSVNLKNSSGDMEIDGLKSNEHMIEATSGDLYLSNIEGNLTVGTTSGEISIKGLKGNLTCESTSGDQEMSDVTGVITTESTSGGLVFNNIEGDIDAKATSGDIELEEINGSINLRSTSGEIEGYDVLLKMHAKLRANSGDISMAFKNEPSDLSYDLTSSSGELEVGSKMGRKTLQINEGGISVIATTTSGNQTFRH